MEQGVRMKLRVPLPRNKEQGCECYSGKGKKSNMASPKSNFLIYINRKCPAAEEVQGTSKECFPGCVNMG